MNYRPLGKTGLTVSCIGFGAWGIGGSTPDWASYGPTEDVESERALKRAFDLGVTLYDTAPVYGRSERLLGDALHDRRDKVVIASKAGLLDQNGGNDFSPSHLRATLQASLRNLRTDYIDLFQLHDPPVSLLRGRPEILEALHGMRKEGLTRAIGLSAKTPADALIGVQELGFEVVQANFNMIDQRAIETGLLQACRDRGAGFIGRTPLCFGFLTGRYPPGTRFEEGDHRLRWPRKQLELWARAYELFEPVIGRKPGQSSGQVAIRYCLSYPEVSSVIPGMLSVSQVEENIASDASGPLEESERAGIEAVYRANTFFIR